MKFRAISVIENILDFVYYKSDFFYIDRYGTVEKYDLQTSNKLATSMVFTQEKTLKSLYRIYGFGVKLLALDLMHNGYAFTNDLSEVVSLPKEVTFLLGEKNKPLLVGEDLDKHLIGAFSVNNNRFKWTRKDIKALRQIGDHFIGQWQFVLTKYNRESGEIEWVHDFGVSFPQLKGANGSIGYKGIQKGIFVVGIKKIDRIFGIDIRTGKILWEKRAITSGKKLDKEKRVIHSFLINYTQLSLENGDKIKSFANRDYFEEIGIETQRNNYVVIGDHIITTDSRKGKIGAFNTNTGIFDWVYEVEGVSFPGGREIVYSAPYLFVHDSNGALHIFEKES